MSQIMFIPKQRSPWEQMLPQIIGQMAMMKVQQNYQAKQQEMELSEKMALAGGKELTPEEVKTPKQQGYRRAQIRGKTYRIPMSTEEQLQQQNIFKAGEHLYQFKNGGVIRITDKESQYQPKLFVDKDGNYKWIEPGQSVPKGFKKWTATSARGITPTKLQKEYEWIKSLPKEEQKKAKEFIAWKYSVDPFRVLLQKALEEGDLEEPGSISGESERLPNETTEEYLERIGE